jgi:multicomponent Na+:H+ antiporter subunit B
MSEDKAMSTVIFRTIVPFISALMVVYSIFVLLRGHNEPGGGFIGGLVAASAIAVYGIATSVAQVRQALVVHPIVIAAFGAVLAGFAGVLSFVVGKPFMTGLWWFPEFLGAVLPLSTPLIFDIGVWLVVVGAISSIALALEEPDYDEGGVN